MKHRSALLAAVLAGIGGTAFADAVAPTQPYYRDPPTPSQAKRWRDQRGYPQTGTGNRAAERLMRQKANYMLDFKASERCLAAIKARLSRT